MIRKFVSGLGKRYLVVDTHRIIPVEVGAPLFPKLAVNGPPFRAILIPTIFEVFLKMSRKRSWLIKASFVPNSFLRKHSLGRHKINAKIIISNGLLPLEKLSCNGWTI